MSELANKLVQFRGKKTQAEVSKRSGVSLRLISRIESGSKAIRLETLEDIAFKGIGVDDAQWIELVISWLRLRLGPYYNQLTIEPTAPRAGRMNDKASRMGRIQVLASNLTVGDQDNLIKVLERPELVKALRSLNDMYEKVSK